MMNLIYPGIAYQTSIAGTGAPETQQTGTFLDRAYKLRWTQVTCHQFFADLIYRGVHYSCETDFSEDIMSIQNLSSPLHSEDRKLIPNRLKSNDKYMRKRNSLW